MSDHLCTETPSSNLMADYEILQDHANGGKGDWFLTVGGEILFDVHFCPFCGADLHAIEDQSSSEYETVKRIANVDDWILTSTNERLQVANVDMRYKCVDTHDGRMFFHSQYEVIIGDKQKED